MPGSGYQEICNRLTAAGFAQETPCAIISRATTPEQRIYRTTVSDLRRAPRFASPTLLVVGEVVKFADRNLVDEAASFPELKPALEAALAQSVGATFRTDKESLP